jgi:hypothetical protein
MLIDEALTRGYVLSLLAALTTVETPQAWPMGRSERTSARASAQRVVLAETEPQRLHACRQGELHASPGFPP